MELRRFVRGNVGWPRLETIARELAERYDCEGAHVRFLDADNWLSTPFVLDDRYFVKVISKQNSLVHALFTTGRNLGAFTSGTEGFFEHFGTPYQMAEHELEATRRMREIGLNAPEPVEALEIDGLGVLVLEYLPEFRPLDELDVERERELAPELFRTLHTMHDHGLAHGDLRAENVLILDGDLYLIDATNIRGTVGDDEDAGEEEDRGVTGLLGGGDEPDRGEPTDEPTTMGDAGEDARRYDLACGLAALEPLIGAPDAVDAALSAYSLEDLLGAREYLDFVRVRPDHDFDGPALKGEIEKRADGDEDVRAS
ncbi:RIO1 family regulatory kinase/ATPase domain-containing protein [Halorarum halophilum]|uniref:RIO1 family regulatory kinase/ATPase domain-containing protein n=1 Tax=Halorarum halophilum TaxID=2743090 RepID=UPI001FEB121E|nr:RIO1 family regulatory kinase/ATPase [Halobaculum halophilum]